MSPGLCLGIDRTSLLAHRGRRPSCRHSTLAFFFSLPRCHSLFGGLLYQTLTRVARTVALGSGPTLVCAGLGKLWVARQGGDDAEMRMGCKVMALQAPALPPATTAANQHQWTLLNDASCGAMAQSGQVVLQHRARYVVPLVSDWPATALVEQRIHFNCLMSATVGAYFAHNHARQRARSNWAGRRLCPLFKLFRLTCQLQHRPRALPGALMRGWEVTAPPRHSVPCSWRLARSHPTHS